MIRTTVERVEVSDLDGRNALNCGLCDGTGKQTKRGENGETWRFPMVCLPCNGTGVNAAEVRDKAEWLMQKDRFATGDGYRKVIGALLKLVVFK